MDGSRLARIARVEALRFSARDNDFAVQGLQALYAVITQSLRAGISGRRR
jgi:hypothetical protein